MCSNYQLFRPYHLLPEIILFSPVYCGCCSLLQYIPERQAYKDRWVGALRTSQVPGRLALFTASGLTALKHLPDRLHSISVLKK